MQDHFYVELRELKKCNKFYVRFINQETGEILPHRSVEAYATQLGLLEKGEHIKRKKEAERICTLALEKNLVYMANSDIQFIKYAQDFWSFEGDRIRRRNLRKKGSIGKDYAMIMYANIDRYIKPYLPKDIQLKKITSKHVEGVVNALLDKGDIANATIQKIQQTLAQPLTHAYKKGLLRVDPTKNLEAIDTSSKTARGAFTPSEVVNLISRMSRMENKHAYLAVVLSAATGMRQGEIMALRASNIVPVNEKDSLITIEEAFAKKAGIKDPKGKKVRYAPIAKPIADALVNFASKNTFGNDLVFWSFTSKTKPCSATYIQDGLYEALADMLEEEAHCIGEMVKDKSRLDDEGNPINIRKGEELRKARNLVFHGLRYFFVSQLRGKVNDTTLRLTVGHQSEAMTDHYTQVAYGNLIDMADASRKLFDFPEVEKPSFS